MSTVKSSNGERVMERIQELEQYVREQWAERTRIKRDFLMEHYEGLAPDFQKALIRLIDEQSKKDSMGKIQYIYLNRLLSSVYTESYVFVIGMAGSELFLDENKNQIDWYPKLVYENINKDMEKVEDCLRKKFIRLKEYELFRLKRILLEDDWKILHEIFLLLMKDSINILTDSSLQLENELQILAGNYMDRPEALWKR